VDLSTGDIIGICDRAGIVAFAFSGVEVGVQRKLDVFGLLVMGVVTATGGGVMRDVILGRLPLVLDRDDYLLWALAASVIAIVVVAARREIPRRPLAVADAAGLGAFTAAGALAAIYGDLGPLPTVLLAMLTATGGGILRDVLAARVPLVLRSEVNATAAAAGGVAVWLVEPASAGVAALVGVGLTAGIRLLSLVFHLNLPVPGTGEGRQGRLL